MSDEDWTGCIGCVLVGILFLGLAFYGWYRAGVQQEVYKRQGCEMSQWEVFMGAKPIDRQLVPVK